MLYSYAKLSAHDFGIFRILGTGLGQLLFPWARFKATQKKYDLKPISPTWLQIRLGPILRNEQDKRFYNNLFKVPKDQVKGWEKLFLLSTLPRISETDFIFKDERGLSSAIVVFEGSIGYFSTILKSHEMIKNELIRMTLDKHKNGLNYKFGLSITVHVRLGDFSVAPSQEIIEGGGLNTRLPLAWYVRVINLIRSELGKEIPVHVFSDGTDEDLSDLLMLPNTQRMGFGSSIADIFALSQSRILIASSIFSMWASYIGRMPVIWHKGQLKQKLYFDNPTAEIEVGMNDEIPASFFGNVNTSANM